MLLFSVCSRKGGLAQWMVTGRRQSPGLPRHPRGCIPGDTHASVYSSAQRLLCLTDDHPSTSKPRTLELRKSGQGPRTKHGRQGYTPRWSQSRLDVESVLHLSFELNHRFQPPIGEQLVLANCSVDNNGKYQIK